MVEIRERYFSRVNIENAFTKVVEMKNVKNNRGVLYNIVSHDIHMQYAVAGKVVT